MNKFKLLAIALVMGATSLIANNIENPNTSKDEIRKQIIELLEDSSTKISADTYINITFTFNTEGEIVVLKVESIDKEILSFIRENINGKKIEKPGKVNKQYVMPINVIKK